MLIWVTEARPLENFTLWLRFSDRSEGKVDLREFIESDRRPIVRQLRDPAVFADLKVASDTVVWANGFDLAPEFCAPGSTRTQPPETGHRDRRSRGKCRARLEKPVNIVDDLAPRSAHRKSGQL